eukprot:Lithocolla_globosa_v1_NODE_307_length_4577_cov_13.906457.p3 type:complete len:231 gc:universal NODE_307_length_4577_cov_13.906457:3567-2875(-)
MAPKRKATSVPGYDIENTVEGVLQVRKKFQEFSGTLPTNCCEAYVFLPAKPVKKKGKCLIILRKDPNKDSLASPAASLLSDVLSLQWLWPQNRPSKMDGFATVSDAVESLLEKEMNPADFTSNIQLYRRWCSHLTWANLGKQTGRPSSASYDGLPWDFDHLTKHILTKGLAGFDVETCWGKTDEEFANNCEDMFGLPMENLVCIWGLEKSGESFSEDGVRERLQTTFLKN